MLNRIPKFNDIKIRNKLLILYLFFVLIPIIFTNVFFYQMTINSIRKQKMNDVQLIMNQIANDFIVTIDQAVGVSTRFYTDAEMYDFFEQDYERPIDYIEAYDYYLRYLNRITPLYYSIQAVTFYTDNDTVLFAGGVRPIHQYVDEINWYDEVMDTNGPILLRPNPETNSRLFSVIRELDFYKNKSTHEKIIKVDINPLTIEQLFANVTLQGDIYLLNEKGGIEYRTNGRTTSESDEQNFYRLQLPEDVLIEERSFYSNYLKGWKVVGVIDEKEALADVYNSSRVIFTLAFINFLFPSLLIILIARSLNVRISRVLRSMKKAKGQTFEMIKDAEDKDEIGQLTTEFNRMSSRINHLINEVYVANIQKKDLELREKQAQLSALRSQINPHFLFNALETIRMRSIIKDETETAKIIQNMAKIFRNSLTWEKEWVSIRDELKIIHCFLEIQKYRFNDKIEFQIDCVDAALDYKIPNMTFLPFVENASIHGVEAIKEKGRIHLNIDIVEGTLIFTLTDNGAGMKKEQLEQLLRGLKEDDSMGEHVGIKNVYYRLKFYYQNDFDFSIYSSPQIGTTVVIKIFQKKQE
ncbi:sensor histidine kinase [Alkalihalobacillus pseudalcaliphilus]|uniref:sensor histidine kinase n=1 Tax=Alkalihalobacillus pseudalcaliphilus TaxID=79884 RepID=UPI00064E116D|nr:sensor histidine kinase [Alkalihalobacillus pseudalcaliphilus]KMK75562.1 histidine kinase [Alkalihalobacillus pseudalcaliphilus]